MENAIRLVGIGQPAAGDDAVGISVVREVARQPWSKKLEIHETADPLSLIDWMDSRIRMILVDAVVENGRSGTVLRLVPEDLARGGGLQAVSSHGFDVARVIALARTLSSVPERSEISIVAVAIRAPVARSYRLSPEVAAAIPEAVAMIRSLVED